MFPGEDDLAKLVVTTVVPGNHIECEKIKNNINASVKECIAWV